MGVYTKGSLPKRGIMQELPHVTERAMRGPWVDYDYTAASCVDYSVRIAHARALPALTFFRRPDD